MAATIYRSDQLAGGRHPIDRLQLERRLLDVRGQQREVQELRLAGLGDPELLGETRPVGILTAFDGVFETMRMGQGQHGADLWCTG